MTQLSFPKEKIKIVLLEDIHPTAIKMLKDSGYTNIHNVATSLQEDELIHVLQDARALGIRSRTKITEKVISQANHLMVVGCFCIGTDQVDLNQATLHGIPVFNSPHSNTRSVAELVLGLIVMLLRDIFHKSQAAHRGQWLKQAKGCHEVRGKNLGIIGYGNIGSQVSILAEDLGMNVFYYDIEPKLPIGNAHPVHKLEDLLEVADIVTLHVPDTPLTRLLMNETRIQKMKKGACLINTSRGKVVDLDALQKALTSDHIMGAAIDVYPEEPKSNDLPFHSSLQGLENVILTPHIAGSTLEAQQNIALEVVHKLIDFLDKGSTVGSTNFPLLSLAPNENTHRILHTHQNIPGILKQINQLIADQGINIISQYLKTNESVGYLVLDINKNVSKELYESIKNIPGTIKTRVLY